MGGSRVRISRWMFNIMVVFLLSGLWHGAGWTYVAWGGLNGLLLLVEGLWYKLRKKKRPTPEEMSLTRRLVGYAGVFIAWTLQLIVFRSESFWQVGQIVKSSINNLSLTAIPNVDVRTLLFLGIFILSDILLRNNRFDRWCIKQRPVVQWGSCFLLAFCILAFASVDTFPFIYFQF